jgi:hypothetical protein
MCNGDFGKVVQRSRWAFHNLFRPWNFLWNVVASKLLGSEHCHWLLRVARETSEMNHRSFAVKLLVHSPFKGARWFLLAHKHICTTHYRSIMWGHCRRTCTRCTCRDGKGWATALADRWCLRNVYDYTEPKWLLHLKRWTNSDHGQDVLSQKLFAPNTLGIVRKRFTVENSSSQEVAKRLFNVILQSGECRLSFCVLYANKCSRKSSTTFRQWCHAFFAYQDQWFEWHGALTIHIVSCKSIWYESSVFLQSEFEHWTKQITFQMNFSHCWHQNYAMK